MPARIRLQRHGKKNQPFYHIVVADGRAPRDGRFIEKLGTYNPLTNPATIDLNFDRAVEWVKNGFGESTLVPLLPLLSSSLRSSTPTCHLYPL